MIIIKKYYKYLALLVICLLSFYYTEKVALYVKSKNPLMIKLNDIKDSKYVHYINSNIIDDIYIIPGINGKELNIDSSFSNMHPEDEYNEEYLVFNSIKPSISLEENKDKIIIKGNKEKQSVSIILEDYNQLSNYLISKEYKVDILLKDESYNKKYELINNSNNKDIYNNIEYYLDTNDINKNLCYIKEDNSIPPLCVNKYLFKPSLIISHSNISNTLNKISSGDIILLKDTLSISELAIILNQISYRNLSIVPLSLLISENN